MVREVSGRLVDDVAAQLALEASARRTGMTIARAVVGMRLRYRFAIDVPVHDDERLVTVEFAAGRSPGQPRVCIDGPRCLRHRYLDDSLCLWLGSDPGEQRWVPADGLLDLVGQIELHAYCEAECRAGKPWPKPEAPGRHQRKSTCPSCPRQCSSR